MERLRELKGLDQVPRPCDYFDLIGGTSTGGCGPLLSLFRSLSLLIYLTESSQSCLGD